MFSGLPPEADIDRGGRHVSKVPKAVITLVPNRLLSSFQRHNSSLHCFSYADALNDGKERGEELR
jgi:hypothetical protein